MCGGCLPGGQGSPCSETWSCSHCGELSNLTMVYVVKYALKRVWFFILQGQYQTLFEAVMVYLTSFDTYSNFVNLQT